MTPIKTLHNYGIQQQNRPAVEAIPLPPRNYWHAWVHTKNTRILEVAHMPMIPKVCKYLILWIIVTGIWRIRKGPSIYQGPEFNSRFVTWIEYVKEGMMFRWEGAQYRQKSYKVAFEILLSCT